MLRATMRAPCALAFALLLSLGFLQSVRGSASDRGQAGPDPGVRTRVATTVTNANRLYLPFVSMFRPCTPPLDGTVSIIGQATVQRRPAKLGVPFTLWRRHFEYPPTVVMTTTTGTDGRFCLTSVPVLQYCHGIWYDVAFHYTPGTLPDDDYRTYWSQQIIACEPGKVYTVTAEIGE